MNHRINDKTASAPALEEFCLIEAHVGDVIVQGQVIACRADEILAIRERWSNDIPDATIAVTICLLTDAFPQDG